MNRFLDSGLDIVKNLIARRQSRVVFISERADWVIKDVAVNLTRQLNLVTSDFADYSLSHLFLKNKILHWSSINTVLSHGRLKNWSTDNQAVLSWFHILNDDPRLKYLPELDRRCRFFHTTCSITKNLLIKSGIAEEKIIIIPLGVDLDIFKPVSADVKSAGRARLGIPSGKIVVGSFQKDGCGWGEGEEPKYEKGPDIFCDTVERLARNFDIHVLLTGPARGFVKKRLIQASIGFTHQYLKNYSDIPQFYNLLDLYLVTSRIEGGPKAILESWATGIPLVSTRMGMAADLVEDGINGFLGNVNNSDMLAEKAAKVLSDDKLRNTLIANGLTKVINYRWDKIAQQYYNFLYQPILDYNYEKSKH